MDKISVIVPVYNIAPYLRRCVESICAQTYQNLEIILVDDGSTDNSLEVMQELAKSDRRIMPLHKDNGGVTSARLEGVSQASGEWIGFIDGDDFIEPNMYEHLLSNAQKYNADISHCGYQMVFPTRTDYYYNTGKLILQDNETGLKDLLEAKFVEPGLCNKLYNKSLLQSLFQKMDLTIKNNEDLLMNYYLFKQANKSVYEDFCPYHYMVRKGSASQCVNSSSNKNDPLKVLQIIKSDCVFSSCLPALNGRIACRLIAQLNEKNKEARDKLKIILPEVRRYCNLCTCMQVTMAAYCFGVYDLVHKLYRIIRGGRKYTG